MAKVSNLESAPIIRSLDLGFGFTKYSKKENDEIVFKDFPSIAPRASKVEDSDLSFLNERDTLVVKVDGSDYEVGPDSLLLESTESTRSLNDQYIFTAQYRALTMGALAYMNEPVIDLLVVGLPVSNYSSHHESLKKSLMGTHQVNDNFSCEIKNVMVIYQPLGGLKYCMSIKSPEFKDRDLANSNNLIIDPGFLTFDFLMSIGNKVIEKKSNAHAGGVSKILNAIGDSISKKIGKKYDNFNAIDKALRRRKIKINGKDEDLLEHIKNTKSVIESPIIYMKNMIGDGSDIDNIILIGGGSSIFERTLKEHYPQHEILVIEEPAFANVKGYQIIGEENYQRLIDSLSKQ